MIALCVAAFVACAALGAYVSSRTPTRLDIEATALRGDATSLAIFFSALGRWKAVVAIAAVAYLLALASHADPRLVAWLFASQVLGQAASMASKRLFRRVRPDGWLVRQERDLSYPSGHSTTAIVFFGGLLALVLADLAAPWYARDAVAVLLAICVVGIPWSRLALGAHYATDVIGGLLFGIGWLSANAWLFARSFA